MSEQQFQAEVMDELRQKEQKMNTFEKLSKLNVSDHVEKKGRFSYLSWTWAVSELRKAAPDATWEVIKYDGMPFCKTECGYFVEVAVTVDGIALSQIHPVLDNNNKTIPVPNAFQINTSIQRCLVKAIALHGLGLYIYAGEDLPEVEKEAEPEPLDATAYVKSITDTKTLEELQNAYKTAYIVCKMDKQALLAITIAKDQMKHLFETNKDFIDGYNEVQTKEK